MCRIFDVPAAVLPKVGPSSGRLAVTRAVGENPEGIARLRPAAISRLRFRPTVPAAGDAKCTFGTGSFLLMNVGPRRARAVTPPTAGHSGWQTSAGTALRFSKGVLLSQDGSFSGCGTGLGIIPAGGRQ